MSVLVGVQGLTLFILAVICTRQQRELRRLWVQVDGLRDTVSIRLLRLESAQRAASNGAVEDV